MFKYSKTTLKKTCDANKKCVPQFSRTEKERSIPKKILRINLQHLLINIYFLVSPKMFSFKNNNNMAQKKLETG